MNKLGKFLKNVFVRKLWIKLAAVFLAIFEYLIFGGRGCHVARAALHTI